MKLMEKKNYDLTQITRVLLEIRDNCVPKDGEAYDDPKRMEKYDALMSKCALTYIHQLENHIGELTEKVKQLEAARPKWISVEDRLPEKDGKCIVCTAKGSVYCTRFKAYGKSGSFQTDINTHITHWMSLPEPPEVRA